MNERFLVSKLTSFPFLKYLIASFSVLTEHLLHVKDAKGEASEQTWPEMGDKNSCFQNFVERDMHCMDSFIRVSGQSNAFSLRLHLRESYKRPGVIYGLSPLRMTAEIHPSKKEKRSLPWPS